MNPRNVQGPRASSELNTGTGEVPGAFSGAIPQEPENPSFIIVADTQRTGILEFWRERNNPERRRILEAIARERPAFVIHLGDMVYRGDSPRHWADFDEISRPLRAAGIPVWPIPGNHEYRGNQRRVLAEITRRFPHLEGGFHHSLRYRGIGILLIDSNLAALDAARWRAELDRIQREVESAEGDPTVRAIIACAHHPPFSNSRLLGDNEDMKRDVVPILLAARKAILFASGHVHGYECLEVKGKVFLVCGGGGGPRAQIETSPRKRRHADAFPGGRLRPFHYLRLTPSRDRLLVETMMLEKGDSEPVMGHTVSLPLDG